MLRQLFRREDTTHIDPLIDEVITQMHTIGVDSPEYDNMLKYLERLKKLKTHERREIVSPDTIAIIVGNLAGILLIVAYEQKHVITSKGFTQILRLGRPGSNNQP